MPKEIFEVVRERFHLSDKNLYIVQGHWPKEASMEVYLDNKKLEVSVKENNNVSALERFQDPEKLEGMQVTAEIRIPEDLNGFHKLVIYEKFAVKKQPGFLLQRVSWRKKETGHRFISKRRKQNRELYASEDGRSRRSR